MNRWVVGARPRTLPAAIVPVVVGTACAVGEGGVIAWRAVAALVVALAIQVATNYAERLRRRRARHGHRPRRPDSARGLRARDAGAVKKAALVAMLVAAVAGLALAVAVTPWLLLVGAASFAAGYFYTGGPRPYGYLGLGEVFVFVFFGVVATVGSAFVQIEAITAVAVVASIPVGLLATALLVVNNLRDIPTDGPAGKRTLAVRMGDRKTRFFYVGLIVVAFVVLPVFGALGRPLAALAFLAVLVARRPVQRVLEGASGPALIPVLGETGRLQIVFGALLAAGLCYVP